jgi:hypothetical protein
VSEISEAAKAKARDLMVEARNTGYASAWTVGQCEASAPDSFKALARYIQQVSDAANAVLCALGEPKSYHEAHLAPFILPDPVDPLVEALELSHVHYSSEENAAALRAELAKRGLEIREVQP